VNYHYVLEQDISQEGCPDIQSAKMLLTLVYFHSLRTLNSCEAGTGPAKHPHTLYKLYSVL